MTKNMLIAVSKMLEKSKDKNVKCAKTVIDEIVNGMSEPVQVRTNGTDEIKKYEGPKAASKKEPEFKGKVVCEHGRIKSIEGVPLDTTMIELDGVAMTCAEAIGKTFQNAKAL